MAEVDLHSRSRLAGYQPETLFQAVALVVGAGALGQNLAVNLALAGFGEIDIVDFDTFEAHNATRSPLYPTVSDQAILTLDKATVVAHKLFPMMTAPTPKIRYASVPIQALGELPIQRAHLVFSAVDNLAARAYLAERCRLLHRPMIEGGFRGEALNMAVFGVDSSDPCYRCLNPKKEGAHSCTRYALQVEAAQAIPAIQNTASVLAGLQAETGIQWLHDERTLKNTRVYADIRTMKMNTAQISRSPVCPGIHWEYRDEPIFLDVAGTDSVQHLLETVEQEVGLAWVHFPEPLVVRNACYKCKVGVEVHAPEWRWLISPFCEDCGGPFRPIQQGSVREAKTGLYTNEAHEITSLTCAELGFPPGAIFEVWPRPAHPTYGELCLMQLKGSISQLMQEVSPTQERQSQHENAPSA